MNVSVNIIRLVIRVNVVPVVTMGTPCKVRQMIAPNVHVQKMDHVSCTLMAILFAPNAQLDILAEGGQHDFAFFECKDLFKKHPCHGEELLPQNKLRVPLPVDEHNFCSSIHPLNCFH